MKILWSPWRMKYLLSPKPEGCIFCEKMGEDRDRDNYILYRGQAGCIILNLYPYNAGHLMIVPNEHVPSLEELEPETLTEIMLLVNKGIAALREAMCPQGFNVGINIGKAAGAGVDTHVHIHVVPRWDGDTNFITIFNETRVVPELLNDTYDKLKAILAAGE